MVASCAAFACANNKYKCPDKSFHRYPLSNQDLLHKWMRATQRVTANGEDWLPTKNHFLCSDHFTENDYQLRPGASKPWLKADAVPSVFPNYPKYLQQPAQTTRKAVKRKPSEDDTKPSTSDLTSDQQDPLVEHDYSKSSSISRADAEETIHQLRKKLHTVTKRARRQQVKINKLSDLVKDLCEKKTY